MERVSRRRGPGTGGTSRRGVLRTGGAAVAAAANGALAGCLGQFEVGGGGDGESDAVADAITLERAAGPGPDAVALAVADRPVVLDFFATWCAPCIPQVETICAVTKERPDVHYDSITAERNREGIEQWWDDYGGDWPAVMDPETEAQGAYSAPRLPTTLVLPPGGGPGDETWRHVGVARSKAVVAAIDEAAAAGSIAASGVDAR